MVAHPGPPPERRSWNPWWAASCGLLDLALQRLPLLEAPVERMPVRDFALAELPAQEHEPVSRQRVEVDQPLVEILHHAAVAVNCGDLAGDDVFQRRPLVVEAREI